MNPNEGRLIPVDELLANPNLSPSPNPNPNANANPNPNPKQVREGRELVSQLEARLEAQAARVQEQDAQLLTYARAQGARDLELRAREAALVRQLEGHRARLDEWRDLVARREAALQVSTLEAGVRVLGAGTGRSGGGRGAAREAALQVRRGSAPRNPPCTRRNPAAPAATPAATPMPGAAPARLPPPLAPRLPLLRPALRARAPVA